MVVRVEPHAEPIPGYRLVERIGGGGFGEVWRADAPGGLHKAIKFVFGDLSGASDSQRAEQELKALRRVQSVRHPYILSLERIDIIDGQLMIVMELADRNLWDRFKECRTQGLPGIPRGELLRYMEETAEALDLMNQEYDLQHLDVKPQNIFLVHNHVKVADFGLVKDLEGSQASVTGGITPVYAAPETFDGIVTRFSDQYSLAILYQELLTGQRPYAGNNVRQLILQHLQGVPNVTPLPASEQPHVLRALSKKPNDRFPTCKAFVDALRGSMANNAVSPSSHGHVLTGQVMPSSPPTHHEPAYPTPLAEMPADATPAGAMSDTPSAQGVTQNLRSLESVLREPIIAERPRSPQETTGPGCLFPSLVIGLGQMGLTVLQKTRETLHTYAAPLNQLGNVRFLLLDTDPEVLRTAPRGLPAAALGANDALIAPLNRPSHYLKPRDGRPPLQTWMNTKLLYRIPRSQVTTGVRALGRLAFIDNYRSIIRRLQMELDSILNPQTLQAAARASQLGLRTNRPRVYVVTSVGGGSGSGMFLDVAYNLRALLKQMGYDNPDVVALLLLPPVDGSRTRLLTLGNAYAALAELNHFADPDTTFKAKYHDREAPIEDSEPPFSRTIALPLPDETDEVAAREMVELCAQMLHRELATPFGRAADLGRAGLPSVAWEKRGQYAQTFGLFQLTWPRHALLRTTSRDLCRRIVNRWLSKDSKPVRESVGEWITQQWTYLDLGADAFIHRIQTEVIKALGGPPEKLFREALEAIDRSEDAPPPPRRGKPEPRRLLPEQVADVLRTLEELVGRPDDDSTNVEPPRLSKLVREITEKLAAEWSQKLVELPVRLIEDPRFRLAGAEEAIRLIVSNVEHVLQHHEPLSRDIAERALDAHDHLRVAAGGRPREGSKLTPKSAEQIVEMLRQFPKWRIQYLILTHLSSAFVSLRGHLNDELREINFCRARLTELMRLLEETPASETAAAKSSTSKEGGIGRVLFVSGCKDLTEAAALTMQSFTDERMLELDAAMEQMLREKFTALVHVCLASQSVLKPLEKAMLQTASDFVAKQLPATSVASLFFDQHESADDVAGEVIELYHQAAPELPMKPRASRQGTPTPELCVVAAPADEGSEKLRKMMIDALPHVEVQTAAATEDVLIYRERVNLPLSELEQLGPAGHEAYSQMSSNDNFTPHSRSDVEFRK